MNCKECINYYSHDAYSQITHTQSTKYRCKAIGHKELKDITEQDKQRCSFKLLIIDSKKK